MSGFQGLFRIPANTLCPAAPANEAVLPLYHAQVKSVLKSVSLIPGGALAKAAAAVKLSIMDGETVLAELDSAVAAWWRTRPRTLSSPPTASWTPGTCSPWPSRSRARPPPRPT